jgi:hypothetical protein
LSALLAMLFAACLASIWLFTMSMKESIEHNTESRMNDRFTMSDFSVFLQANPQLERGDVPASH